MAPREPLLTGDESLKDELRKRSAFLREIVIPPCRARRSVAGDSPT